MPPINPLIFRAYDIRGIADPVDPDQTPDLTPETVELIGKGIGTYIIRHRFKGAGRPRIAVGRDGRLTSEALTEAIVRGLTSTGCDVTEIGLSSSPLLYYATCKYEFDGGINITASHNPKPYNGVKVVGKHAHSICGDELQDILKLIQNEDFETGEGDHIHQNPFEDYLEDLAHHVSLPRPLKVVIDAGNGVAGLFVPTILRSIGCEVTELYCDVDGNFPNHEANPEEEENMQDLIAKVKEVGADIGMGFDGDGDRIGVVDENGKHYSADYLLMLLARDLLERMPGSKIVFDVKVSQAVIDDISNHGGEPVMSRTGHSFIETKMKEIDSPLAGEVSGHLFFGEDYYGFDDAALAAVRLLQYLARHDKTFSQHFDDVPKMFTTPEFKAPCPDDKKFGIVDELKAHFTANYDCITIDGVRVNFTPHAWGAVRCSNTSPNLTLRFEADTAEKLAEIQAIMVEQLRKHPDIGLNWYQE